MKSNIEKVYSKLPQKKHNLGKQKVDLSLINSLNNSAVEADKLWELAVENFNSIKNEIDKSLDLVNQAIKISEDANIVAEEVDRLSDELGLDFNSQIDDAMQTHFGILEGYGVATKKDLQDALSALNF
tara:strand:- start:403 stop:786 length:384 start_codon:yes stop_codon:yes gene_type:complete